jgi:uncharacterized membrane protein
MIGLPQLYLVAGLMFAGFAALASARAARTPRALANGLFWALLAASFLVGDALTDFQNGLLVLALILVGGFGLMASPLPQEGAGERARREAGAERLGNRLFLPALLIPAIALAGTLLADRLLIGGRPLIDLAQATLVALGAGVLVALLLALLWLKPPPLLPLREGARIMEQVGWAAILPQTLAALGGLFGAVGLGEGLGGLATTLLPEGALLAAVFAYTLGMALLTMAFGNAFAAFPVMTAAIGLPILVGTYHGNPAVVTAIGMLSGFCGTLMTPMAANFNIVPARLLELQDRLGVVKAQVPTALVLLLVNSLFIRAFAFP